MYKVHKVAQTRMLEDEVALALDNTYTTEDDSASDLAEFAGRACYQSWHRPNPDTASTKGYLKHILDVKHGSVLEHGSVTLYITGVSRSFTHELVRHRHLSFSQLSQRFVRVTEDPNFVVPPLFEGHPEAYKILHEVWTHAVQAYIQLIELGNTEIGDRRDISATSSAKKVREAARAVLPNMTQTAIVVTGNHRAWREFIEKRASLHADAEMREVAVEIFRELRRDDPWLYQDMTLCNTGEYEWVSCGDA